MERIGVADERLPVDLCEFAFRYLKISYSLGDEERRASGLRVEGCGKRHRA